ncbi:uncharacterized protein LOC131676188 [Topomyia yanbarensis]|uniref:uncharacterized protein LOC131676188 n=1 Tax=Topomyia yanbarensis TaxID=2498891 RepID=UPI00273CBFEB|nr:uncharacterized protein LOC131676188 [Topomyia yanbarensis]
MCHLSLPTIIVLGQLLLIPITTTFHPLNGSDNGPIWLHNVTVQSHIAAIFERIDNIDIVIADQGSAQMDQIDRLVRGGANGSGILQRKSFRIYGQASAEDEGCTGDRSLLSAKVHITVSDSPDSPDTMDRDYEDEFEFIQWDRSYGSFVKIWDQNQDSGYVVFANLSTFETLMRCLLDPAGTYLILLNAEGQFERDKVSRLLRSIWRNQGVFRLFIVSGAQIYTFDPFVKNGSAYGSLFELREIGKTPVVPQGDFKGYPLRIDMFWSTYSVPLPNNMSQFLGADVVVGEVFVKALNFTAIYLPPDKDNFGSLLPNGSFNGVIGRLTRHESDITFIGYFIKDYFSRDVEFTSGVYTDELCCLVKKASRVPEYLLPITIFPGDLWGLLFLMGIVCTVAWIVLRTGIRLRATTRQERWNLATLFNLSNTTRDAPLYRRMLQICVDTYMLLVSAPYRRFSRSGTERLLLFGIVMVSLIFVSVFQSRLSSIFVNPVYYKDINSLLQLDQSGLTIPVKYKGFMDDVFPANYSTMMQSLRNKLIFQPTNQSVLAQVAKLGTIATVTRKATLSLDNAIFLSTKQLYMIPECPRMYNLAYVIARHSVLLEQVNGILLRMLNGGLINHWINQMNYNVTLHHGDQIRSSQDSDFKILTVVDLQFPFYLLGLGLAISTLVFAGEQIYFRSTNRAMGSEGLPKL